MQNRVVRINASDNLKKSINQLVLDLGGWDRYLKRGDRVLLKPNFNTADPFPASTDRKFLKACAELFYEKGAIDVIVGDSSTFSVSTDRVMKKLKIYELEKQDPPVTICNFDKSEKYKRRIAKGKFLKSVTLPKILDRVERVVLLPCCKTHYIAKFTGALKLSVGFMKKSEKMLLHRGNVEEKIAELNTMIKPDLVIMDARKIFITEGPTKGEVRSPDLFFASESRIAIDIEGIKTIKGFAGNDLKEIDENNLAQIRYSKELGLE